jgi:hypothetical protein
MDFIIYQGNYSIYQGIYFYLGIFQIVVKKSIKIIIRFFIKYKKFWKKSKKKSLRISII